MRKPEEYWQETHEQREVRIARQEDDRASCVNDGMELVHAADLDEIFAELLRLHRIVGDPRTDEMIHRTLPERMGEYRDTPP